MITETKILDIGECVMKITAWQSGFIDVQAFKQPSEPGAAAGYFQLCIPGDKVDLLIAALKPQS